MAPPGRSLAPPEAVDLLRELLDPAGEVVDLLPARDVEGGEGALDGVVDGAADHPSLLSRAGLEDREAALHLLHGLPALTVEPVPPRHEGLARLPRVDAAPPHEGLDPLLDGGPGGGQGRARVLPRLLETALAPARR